MTAHIVWDWTAGCSRLVVLRRQRSCLLNCCTSDWQLFVKQQNYHLFHGGKTELNGIPSGSCKQEREWRSSMAASWMNYESDPAPSSYAAYHQHHASCKRTRLMWKQQQASWPAQPTKQHHGTFWKINGSKRKQRPSRPSHAERQLQT